MARSKTSHKIESASPKTHTTQSAKTLSATTDASFFYQLKNGGASGWNDQRWNPLDMSAGTDKFYLQYYGLPLACAELNKTGDETSTVITVFADPKDVPLTVDNSPDLETWAKMQQDVIVALKDLRICFK